MKFEIGELAILNQHALKGLPDRVGEIVEVIAKTNSPNYDFAVELDNGDLVPVKEKELNHLTMPELDLITYIKRGNKVLYAPMNEEVEIIKVDYLHGYAEVKFYDSAMSIIGFEQLRPIEEKEEKAVKKVEFRFNLGDKVKTVTDDEWNGHQGMVLESYLDELNIQTYRVKLSEHKTLAFGEEELDFVSDVESQAELHFDLLFGHFENEDGTYTVPKQLLHNLLNKIL